MLSAPSFLQCKYIKCRTNFIALCNWFKNAQNLQALTFDSQNNERVRLKERWFIEEAVLTIKYYQISRKFLESSTNNRFLATIKICKERNLQQKCVFKRMSFCELNYRIFSKFYDFWIFVIYLTLNSTTKQKQVSWLKHSIQNKGRNWTHKVCYMMLLWFLPRTKAGQKEKGWLFYKC